VGVFAAWDLEGCGLGGLAFGVFFGRGLGGDVVGLFGCGLGGLESHWLISRGDVRGVGLEGCGLGASAFGVCLQIGQVGILLVNLARGVRTWVGRAFGVMAGSLDSASCWFIITCGGVRGLSRGMGVVFLVGWEVF